eukprot:TRINITY_DN4784_c0_g1_i4.p1 TRINITY_DN4784_c0_g1~~TRINITY_DN4784_c0_g1_i4.p1  ORF type:complete len:203 (-),score=61.99 TRINITY_DN4784_c0_g1_i4:231-839(-)
MSELGTTFGCVRIVDFAERTFSTFKERFLLTLPVERRASTSFAKPVFPAVCFYLCARKMKVAVNRKKLMEVASTTNDEFAKISHIVTELCYDTIGISVSKPDLDQLTTNTDLLDVTANGRLRKSESDRIAAQADAVDLDRVPKAQSAKRSADDYEQWKQRILSKKPASSVTESSMSDHGGERPVALASTTAKKQSTLNFGKR